MRDARERSGHIGRPSNLTKEQRADIRRRYSAGGVRQSDLAREFGVAQMTISNVVRRVYA